MNIKLSVGERVFNGVNIIFLAALMAATLYPFLYVLFGSVSDPVELGKLDGLLLFPKGFQLEGYRVVLQNPGIGAGYRNTLLYVVAGTSLNIAATTVLAYVLSRKGLMLYKPVMLGVVFTMFFNGGLIPTYLMMSEIGLVGSPMALIFPGMINTTNLIIMRTNFKTIPDSLEEAAKIDGAHNFYILTKIIIPLSMPVIAVMLLFYGVGHWNAWFNAMIYLRKRQYFPLQLILREILIFNSTDAMMVTLGTRNGQDISEVIKHATVIVATLPILLVYPYLQKYFIKGIMIGGIKG